MAENKAYGASNGAYHLANAANAAQYQPVRTNNFIVSVDFGSSLTKMGMDASARNSQISEKTATEVIDFSVVSFTPPHFSQGAIEVKKGNSKIYFADVPTFDEGSLVINDFAGADGKSVLMAWQALSYDLVNDIIPSSVEYKKNATVQEFTSDGNLVRWWSLEGCWITKITEDNWDNESSGKKKVTATIRYDRAIPHQD